MEIGSLPTVVRTSAAAGVVRLTSRAPAPRDEFAPCDPLGRALLMAPRSAITVSLPVETLAETGFSTTSTAGHGQLVHAPAPLSSPVSDWPGILHGMQSSMA